MTIPNPEHLFQQAERLAGSVSAGPPRQTDLRRAISATYYALFHAASTEAADAVAGIRNRNSELYALVYRSVEHASIRRLCEELRRPTPAEKYRNLAPKDGFSAGVTGFARAVVELQRLRSSADYDPQFRVSRTATKMAIAESRAALQRFRAAAEDQRQVFATLLLFWPR